MRAILEGVAFSLKDSFTLFAGMRVPVRNVRLGGGGARSALWQQIQANVYGREVETWKLKKESGGSERRSSRGLAPGCGRGVDDACDQAVHSLKDVSRGSAIGLLLN